MAEYAAAGLWMVSTEFGARGFWECGVHYTSVSWETLATDLNALSSLTHAQRETMIYQAHVQVRACGDWLQLSTVWFDGDESLKA